MVRQPTSGEAGQEAGDAYFSRLRFATAGTLGGAIAVRGAVAGLGAAAALALGGMALALAARRPGR